MEKIHRLFFFFSESSGSTRLDGIAKSDVGGRREGVSASGRNGDDDDRVPSPCSPVS
jgi:hypothetical protein